MEGRLFDPRPIFFPRIDDSHRDNTHSSLTAVHCFDKSLRGKAASGLEKYCAEYWFKEKPRKNWIGALAAAM